MKLIAQLENTSLEIYCDTWISVYATIDKWRKTGIFLDNMRIYPYHVVKFFEVQA